MKPAALACIECRRKHLKCGGELPVCNRCRTSALACVYVPSRRGYRHRGAAFSGSHSYRLQESDEGNTGDIFAPPSPVNTTFTASCSNFEPTPPMQQPSGPDIMSNTTTRSQQGHDVLHSHSADGMSKPYLISLYYNYFHPSHPILVPRTYYNAAQYPDYLQQLVFSIARKYSVVGGLDASVFRDAAVDLAATTTEDGDLPKLQALVLYAVVLHTLHYFNESLDCISRACEIAVRLGANVNVNNVSASLPSQIHDESFRRSWWELYTIDGYLAALHRQRPVVPDDAAGPLLPGHDSSYSAGVLDPASPSVAAFKSRFFAPEYTSRHFSSYCHRVEAAQLTRRVIALNSSEEFAPDAVRAVDNAIVGWRLHFPDSCISAVSSPTGEIDCLLFQARFLVNCSSILLHFPRSDLPFTIPTTADFLCVRSSELFASADDSHTVKSIAASQDICDLASMPADIDQHSPLFVCAVILACIVQLAAATAMRQTSKSVRLPGCRDRVVLLLGVLRRLESKWTVAQHAVDRLCRISEVVFLSNTSSGSDTGASASAQVNLSTTSPEPPLTWFDIFSMDDEIELDVTPL